MRLPTLDICSLLPVVSIPLVVALADGFTTVDGGQFGQSYDNSLDGGQTDQPYDQTVDAGGF